MADNWNLIKKLFEIAMTGEAIGTAWQETKMRGGESYTRTVRTVEAMSAALRIMNADSAGRKPDRDLLLRARQIVRLSKWHKTGMAGEIDPDE